jgi:hypothetical protein
MKTRTLITALVLIAWFVLALAIPGAQSDEWYQGQRGNWVRSDGNWTWRSTHGDEWYEGHRGHWYAEPNGWYWLSDNGAEYRRMHDRWEWTHERHKHHYHHH